ncbi:hypothetical protein LSAT2_024042 [Lamellibrachia satsuma]|nr:hypothetical protein LSAT2_024042 [Lamellibrachia satsuma]
MDPKEIERLKVEQLDAIKTTEERIVQLDKYKNDYGELKKRLKTLPNKVRYDVMVPFGKLAFMPGHLIHTNEITVLLGDNWFAEVSAKDAIGISDRRVTDIDRQITELNKQKDLLKPRVDFTSQLQKITENAGGLVEIKEEYDAEKEKVWREQHAEKVRQHKQGMGGDTRLGGREEEATEDEVWKRLEELERWESERGELGSSSEESDEGRSPRARKKSVTWEDEQESEPTSSAGDSTESSEGEDGVSDGEDERLGSVIRFSHSKLPLESSPTGSSSGEEDTTATIRSPADIYQQYLKTLKPKSILKDVKPDQQQSTPVTTPASSETPDTAEAFSGAVVERDVTNTAPVSAVPSGHLERSSDQEQVINMEPHTDKSPQPISTSRKQRVQQDAGSYYQQLMDTGAQVQPKRVSKFRAQRMQQQDIGSDSQQSTDTETQVKPKRVSKFRAQRMQQEAKR